MRTYAELDRDAREGSPFSNSDEGYSWMGNWCDRCTHDAPARRGDDGNGCPLVLVALCGKTPVEWFRQDGFRLGDQYHCIEFRAEDDGGGDDRSKPEDPMPGQGELIPREAFEGARMFVDVVNEARKVINMIPGSRMPYFDADGNDLGECVLVTDLTAALAADGDQAKEGGANG